MTVVDENGEVVEEAEEALPTADENEMKRPRILNLISGNSSTVPNTPAEPIKSLPSSASSHSIQQTLVHKRSISQTLADTATLAAGHAYDNLAEWLQRPQREKTKLDRTASLKEPIEDVEVSYITFSCISNDFQSPCEQKESHVLQLLNKIDVPRDPLISPMYADDASLKQLPPCYFVVRLSYFNDANQ